MRRTTDILLPVALLVWIVALIALICVPAGMRRCVTGAKIRPGQKWAYISYRGNPFERLVMGTNVVLAVKQGWVLYKWETEPGSGQWLTSAQKEWIFRDGETWLLKEAK